MSEQFPTKAETIEAICVQYGVTLTEARRLYREAQSAQATSDYANLNPEEKARVCRKIESRKPGKVRIIRPASH